MVPESSLETTWQRLNAWLWRPNRAFLYWLTTIILVFAVAVTVMDILDLNVHYSVTYMAKTGKVESAFSGDSRVYGLADVARVAPDLKDDLPPGLSPEGSLPVTVAVDRSTLASRVLSRLSSVPVDMVFVVVIWLLRGLALTAVGTPGSPANPFVWVNVRRLRAIGLIIMLSPVVDTWSSIAYFELGWQTLKENGIYTWDVSTMFLKFGIGVVFLIIAEVFASGIRLREDVEGLV